MKNILVCIVAATAIVVGHGAAAKTINPPALPIERAIELATDYVKTQKIDVSQHFLAAVEYRNLHSEYEKPFWRLEWRLLAGTSAGQIVIIVHPDGTVNRGKTE